MKKITISAASIEEALELAKSQHKLLDGEFDFTVLDKGFKGFFGLMARNATIEVKIKNNYYERRLKEFVEKILGKIGLFQVRVTSNGRRFFIELNGANLSQWIDKNKEVVPAIQHLATIFVNRISDTKLCVDLDIEQLREKRRKTLNEVVEQAILKVKKGTKKVILEPMNAGERRIVHELVKKHKDLKSYSIGIEPYRRVVIEHSQNNGEQS